MRLWKHVDGEPYMINPRLGILALQALNPKRRKNMAKHYGARHMAWVRSFRKKNRHHRRHRKHNPYPLAGTVAAIGNYRRKHHRKRNPGGLSTFARGTLGLPPLMPVVYGASGFVATSATQGFLDTLAPAGYQASQSMLAKYVEIGLGIVIVTWAAKHFFGRGASAFVAVGGGIFALQQAVHDFIPGMIPGMHAYTPLKSYTPIRRAQASTMGAVVESAGGAMPQLATRDSMSQLAAMRAPDHGFKQSAGFAADGGMNVVAERFRRF
jgi:hypothetical protein